ncbi:MAG TPA: choice-of-anchor Q domain-containing protein [Dokdonella sp.]
MHPHSNTTTRLGFLLAACLAGGSAFAVDGVVGPGNCNEAGFDAVLATVDGSGGGTISFNCGAATITFSGRKEIASRVTIDGGGTIIFDGGNSSAFFQVFFSADVVLKRLTLQHGIFNAAHALENFGSLTLDRVRVLDNVSTEAAVMNYGSLSVRRSTFSGNSATSASSGDGAAISNPSGELRVMGSTFSGNSAGRRGGAIYSQGPMTVENSTFTNNSALAGGAVYQELSGDATIRHATIVGNNATQYGGGIYNEGSSGFSTLTIGRSIISQNTNGNCDGVLQSDGYNLWAGSTNCALSGPGDMQASLPMGALANNGGATLTMLPQAGNAAINHVPNGQCVLPLDQRDATRPAAAGCDSGAVEVGGSFDLVFYDGFD